MATRDSNVVQLRSPPSLTTEHVSAILEIHRQLSQGYLLVSAAKLAAREGRDAETVDTLLEMADDVLGEFEYINRLESLTPMCAEVGNG